MKLKTFIFPKLILVSIVERWTYFFSFSGMKTNWKCTHTPHTGALIPSTDSSIRSDKRKHSQIQKADCWHLVRTDESVSEKRKCNIVMLWMLSDILCDVEMHEHWTLNDTRKKNFSYRHTEEPRGTSRIISALVLLLVNVPMTIEYLAVVIVIQFPSMMYRFWMP